MGHPFDPGYFAEPFTALASEYPGDEVYPSSQFRMEWGPIFPAKVLGCGHNHVYYLMRMYGIRTNRELRKLGRESKTACPT